MMNFKAFIRKYFSSFFRLFFVPQCPICCEPQATDNVCVNCFSSISFLAASCKKCQEPFEYHVPGVEVCQNCSAIMNELDFYDQMICAMKYNEVIKNLVVRFKNQHDFGLAKLFTKWIINRKKFDSDYIIVPVPLFKKRIIKRGYNQSLILAKCLAESAGMKYMNVLERTRDTNSQATKTIQERADNVKNAFALNKKYLEFVRGKNFIILDDVITTGATLFECAKILHKGGAKNIELVAIARRLKQKRKDTINQIEEIDA